MILAAMFRLKVATWRPEWTSAVTVFCKNFLKGSDSKALEDMIEACEDDEDPGEGEGQGVQELTGEDATEVAQAITGVEGVEVFADADE